MREQIKKISIIIATLLVSTAAFADYKMIFSSENINLPEKSSTNFKQHTFTSCNKKGRYGPSLSQCQAAYESSKIMSSKYKFSVSNGIQSFIIPENGDYKITAYGPEGVNNNNNVGKGAIMEATFNLNSGDVIQVLVGQLSTYSGDREWQGGSGGTFVALGEEYSSAVPLIVAGGGGTNRSESSFSSLMNASTGTSGKDGSGSLGGENGGGSNGGGHNKDNSGGGASGYYGDANAKQDTRYDGPYQGSKSFVSGAIGGDFKGNDDGEWINGAFGGGGPGGWGGAGGGGGYSGGGNSANSGYSGGGGSFISSNGKNASTSNGSFETTGEEPTEAYSGAVQNLNSFNNGKGKVIIEKI